MNYLTKVFETRGDAERVFAKLETIGVTQSQISILATDNARNRHFSIENTTKAEEGAVSGGTVGGLAGAIVGALTSASAIFIPGMNVIVSGYLVSILAGLGAGAVTGGLLGALVGLGFPEHEAKLYEDELKNGNILLAVKPIDDTQRKRIQEILDVVKPDYEGTNVVSNTSYNRQSGMNA